MNRAARRGWGPRRRAPRALGARLRAVVGALALLLTASAALGGRHLVWCAPMQEARAHCCCPKRPADHEASVRVDCCEARVAPALPSQQLAGLVVPAIVPSPVVAILAIAELHAIVDDASPPRARPARDGPPHPVHRSSSVFLI